MEKPKIKRPRPKAPFKEEVQRQPRRFRRPPTHDYLKYYRVVRMWIKQRYSITQEDLDMLLFLYSERLFTKKRLDEYNMCFGWGEHRYRRLKRDGWISEWLPSRPTKGGAAQMEVSYKGKVMIARFYRVLSGEEPITYDTHKAAFTSKHGKINLDIGKKIFNKEFYLVAKTRREEDK
jgi:hypothetical protein